MWPCTGWKSWMWFINLIQGIHWKTAGTLEKCTAFQSSGGALEQSNKHQSNRIYWRLPVSHWLDSLIGPTGLLLVISHLLAVPILVLWVGLEKKLVIKTWMWEIVLQAAFWTCSKGRTMRAGPEGIYSLVEGHGNEGCSLSSQAQKTTEYPMWHVFNLLKNLT
jgi:hypothetical protein